MDSYEIVQKKKSKKKNSKKIFSKKKNAKKKNQFFFELLSVVEHRSLDFRNIGSRFVI